MTKKKPPILNYPDDSAPDEGAFLLDISIEPRTDGAGRGLACGGQGPMTRAGRRRLPEATHRAIDVQDAPK